jgi:type IV pilus assembly protein PilB
MQPNMKNVRIGDVLVDSGFITPTQLEVALKKQKDPIENPEKLKIGDMLLKLGYVSETQLVHALSSRLKIGFVDLSIEKIDIEAVKKLPEHVAKQECCLGYKINNGRLFLATNDPINFRFFDELKVSTGMEIHPTLATRSSIIDAISRTYSQSSVNTVMGEIENESLERAAELTADVDSESLERIDNAPVVKLVNAMVEAAFRQRASDIHIEPFRDRTRIRFRMDGELGEKMSVKPAVHPSLVTRIKILGNMNIAEKRVPLDGRFNMSIDGISVDVRVSSIPTVYGEKVVMRLLTTGGDTGAARRLDSVGLTKYNYDMFKSVIRSPHGVLLVTGPTGSGKSTTLYATLLEIAKPTVNIVTVEDPVEKKIDGITQVPINVKAGMTFAAALRSILRQDPDVVMIGEIRDAETAEIAVRAAITGHLVLSTLHTNDASSTILRLIDMGVPAYMVASSLIGVVAQRLVRMLCPHCREKFTLSDPEDLKLIGVKEPVEIYRVKNGGCRECENTGWHGRTAIHEIIVTSQDIKSIITRGGTAAEIESKAIKNGTRLLRHNVAEMVLDGKTTMDELVKATYSV